MVVPDTAGEQIRSPRACVLLEVKVQICLKVFSLEKAIWRGRAGVTCFELEKKNSVHQGMDVFNFFMHLEKSKEVRTQSKNGWSLIELFTWQPENMEWGVLKERKQQWYVHCLCLSSLIFELWVGEP